MKDTDLIDINGKKIKEGDIVKFRSYMDEPYRTGIIVWDVYTYTIKDEHDNYVDELSVINKLLRYSNKNLEIVVGI